jgi:hypothetical protein
MNSFKTFALFLLWVLTINVNAQTKSDIFGDSNLPVTWLGLDFGQVSYIGDPGTMGVTEMKSFLNKINLLTINEPKKYDIKGTFRKKNVDNNLSLTQEINESVNPDKLIVSGSDEEKLNESTIKSIIENKYKFDNSEKGVGLVMIMESLNKTSELASIWVTFINMDSRELIFTERLTGKAVGFGFRNYWAGAVYSVLKEIDSHNYKVWQKEYVSKK